MGQGRGVQKGFRGDTGPLVRKSGPGRGRSGPGEQPAILAEPATCGCGPRCFVIRRGVKTLSGGRRSTGKAF